MNDLIAYDARDMKVKFDSYPIGGPFSPEGMFNIQKDGLLMKFALGAEGLRHSPETIDVDYKNGNTGMHVHLDVESIEMQEVEIGGSFPVFPVKYFGKPAVKID